MIRVFIKAVGPDKRTPLKGGVLSVRFVRPAAPSGHVPDISSLSVLSVREASMCPSAVDVRGRMKTSITPVFSGIRIGQQGCAKFATLKLRLCRNFA